MSKKRILIVDDEVSILSVLKNSLRKLGQDYEVVTAPDGFIALEELQQKPFDVVVTDYKMGGMNGLELLEAIRSLQPNARVILITAYGSDELESEARRLEAYRYLTKPLEIDSFRQVVQEAMQDLAITRPGILILSDKRYREVADMLEELQGRVGSRCVFLADAGGRIIARVGNEDQLHVEEVIPLLGGGMSTLIEVGRSLDQNADAINLAYQEGEHECLYAINIGQEILLILIVDRGPYSSRLGSVWYYAQQTAVRLRQTMGDTDNEGPPKVFLNEDIEQAFDTELDKLFAGEGFDL